MISSIQYACSSCLERPVVFGDFAHLVGVVNETEQPSPHRVAAILLTAGMLGSAGPNRLHVDLTQSLRKKNISSLRFDLSGIGESLAVPVQGSSLERAAREVSSAIDFLHTHHQIERVVLFGLCSGADDALFAATQDDRVIGLFCVDGFGYRTNHFHAYRLLRNYGPKLFSGRVWRDRFSRIAKVETSSYSSLQPGSDVREFPDRETAADQLKCLAKRDVAMHFHYTGGVGEYYNHAGQFVRMFHGTSFDPASYDELVTTTFIPESDHVAFLIEHRQGLVKLATDQIAWMASRHSTDR